MIKSFQIINSCKSFPCESLPELEAGHRGGSRTATSVLDVETTLGHPGLDMAFQVSANPFIKVDSKHHYFLMSC